MAAQFTTAETVDRALYYARELEDFTTGDGKHESIVQILRTLDDIAIFLEVADQCRDTALDAQLLEVATRLKEISEAASSDALRRGDIVR